jgi:hypothetical protein
MEKVMMDNETRKKREYYTKIAGWKLAYYCEMYRNGKSEDEAKSIADEWVEKKFK